MIYSKQYNITFAFNTVKVFKEFRHFKNPEQLIEYKREICKKYQIKQSQLSLVFRSFNMDNLNRKINHKQWNV